MRQALAAAIGLALLCASCAGDEPLRSRRSPAETGAREVLQRYAPDGWPLARAELERRLEAEFRAADADADGRVSAAEAERINDDRRDASGVVAGRIVDWNKDGELSLDEFAGAARGAFSSIDDDDDGMATAQEANRPAARDDGPRRRRRGD